MNKDVKNVQRSLCVCLDSVAFFDQQTYPIHFYVFLVDVLIFIVRCKENPVGKHEHIILTIANYANLKRYNSQSSTVKSA